MDSETKGPPQTEAERLLERAYTYKEADKFEDALREADAAIKVDPSLAEAHNLRGIALEELGRKDEALAAYRQAIDLDPEFREAKKNLSYLKRDLAEKYQPVTIATYDHTVEANIAKDILESEGIFSVIIETRRGGGFVPQVWGFGRACLQVRKPDVERACELLDIKPVVSEELEKEADEDEERPGLFSNQWPFTRHDKRKRIPPSKKRK